MPRRRHDGSDRPRRLCSLPVPPRRTGLTAWKANHGRGGCGPHYGRGRQVFHLTDFRKHGRNTPVRFAKQRLMDRPLLRTYRTRPAAGATPGISSAKGSKRAVDYTTKTQATPRVGCRRACGAILPRR